MDTHRFLAAVYLIMLGKSSTWFQTFLRWLEWLTSENGPGTPCLLRSTARLGPVSSSLLKQDSHWLQREFSLQRVWEFTSLWCCQRKPFPWGSLNSSISLEQQICKIVIYEILVRDMTLTQGTEGPKEEEKWVLHRTSLPSSSFLFPVVSLLSAKYYPRTVNGLIPCYADNLPAECELGKLNG